MEIDTSTSYSKVIDAVIHAGKIIIVCGAGVSVEAGIPDFRSKHGLFRTIKAENPKARISSGKDLFDASVFASVDTTALFCQAMGRLAVKCQEASPSPFHMLLKALDMRGQLLRVYTQNIDCLEKKAGLTFGIPSGDIQQQETHQAVSASSTRRRTVSKAKLQSSQAPTIALPPSPTPRCIPLHGHLEILRCTKCFTSFSLYHHIPTLLAGLLPTCSECKEWDIARSVAGLRRQGIGKLRPDIVLYNEVHTRADDISTVMRHDLMSLGCDTSGKTSNLLLVVGTSLTVPGVIDLVRMFSKVIRSFDRTTSHISGTTDSSPSNGMNVSVQTVYLNLNSTTSNQKCEGLFDVCIQGDGQAFACDLLGTLSGENNSDLKAQSAFGTSPSTKKRKVANDDAPAAYEQH